MDEHPNRSAPPAWTNSALLLFHGTTADWADDIVANGVRLSKARARRDFGPGFYTTTDDTQARRWARRLELRQGDAKAAVVVIAVDRNQLAGLDVLAFVRSGHSADDYWRFIEYCRSGNPDHARSGFPKRLFDVVYGPFSRKWQRRDADPHGDQISFHTGRAEAMLNTCNRMRIE